MTRKELFELLQTCVIVAENESVINPETAEELQNFIRKEIAYESWKS